MKTRPEQLEIWPISQTPPANLPSLPAKSLACTLEQRRFVRNLASNLMKHRFRSNMTQRQVGKELRLSRATIELIESGAGNPSAYLIFQLSKFYNVSMDELVQDRSRQT